MARFTINDTIPHWVTFSYEIEADNEEDALQRYRDDEAGPCVGTEIGDFVMGIDGVENSIEIMAQNGTPKNTRPIATAPMLVDALKAILSELDQYDNRILEPSCQACTVGQTPREHDKGLCPYHKAREALALAETT